MAFALAFPVTYDFLLANGEVCPRRVVEIINLTPFDWVPRKLQLSELAIPAIVPVVASGASSPIAQPALQTGLPLAVRDDTPSPPSLVVPSAPEVPQSLPLPRCLPLLLTMCLCRLSLRMLLWSPQPIPPLSLRLLS